MTVTETRETDGKKTDKWANLWTHRTYSPFIMAPVLEATTGRLKELFPDSRISKGGSYWRKGKENYFYVDAEVSETVNAIARKTLDDQQVIYGFLKPALEKAVALNDFARKFCGNREALKKKSFDDLAVYAAEFADRFREMYSFGTVPTLMGYREDNPLYAEMNSILKEKTASTPGKYALSLLVLTRPLKRLKTQDQELGVLKIAAKAKRDGLNSAGDVAATFSREIEALYEEFKWVSYDLCDSIAWDRKHFAGLVAEKLVSSPEKLVEEIEFNEHYDERAVSDFERECAALSLSEGERRVFEVVRDIGFYKWAREYEFLHAFYLTKFVQDELGSRCGGAGGSGGLSTLESKYVLGSEWKKAEKNAEELKRSVLARLENCLVLAQNGEAALFEGGAAAEEYAKIVFVREEAIKAASQLRGTPACAGVARGRVNIINGAKDVGKMRDGDVLVSVTTNPDLVPAMKKAVAIVTSEGGVTCHAAIVSRELGIPCVVGVRNVHKILRDGEIVEVDAMHGVVKKI